MMLIAVETRAPDPAPKRLLELRRSFFGSLLFDRERGLNVSPFRLDLQFRSQHFLLLYSAKKREKIEQSQDELSGFRRC
jgi:hypothetical protein